MKDRLYNYFVRKNGRVWYEYERYVREHIDEHKKKRFKHIWILIKLNCFYRIKKGNTPYLYWDVPVDPNEKKTNIAIPYLMKSESYLYNKKEAHYIAKDCMKYDVVSFDIFDTLICRPFDKPEDLFYIVGHELKIYNFKSLRMKAEKSARKKAEVMNGCKEVTIRDIYIELSKITNVDIERGIEKEFEIEKNLCFANEQMQRVFNILKYQNKDIVLTSNMYYPEKMMDELLRKCGYEGYKKIFVSCDYFSSKRTGTLFEVLKKYVGFNKRIIHLGDDYECDYIKAKEQNIDAYFYQNVNNAGRQYRADGMSELTYSAYAGIVNYHLHNGLNRFSESYEYGFIYGGIYVFGFCNWIHQYVKEHNIDKVIFLSRDGRIYQDVFNIVFNDVENEYLYWSRVANIKYTLDENYGKYYYLLRVVDDRVNSEIVNASITLKELFSIFGIESLIPLLKEYRLLPSMVLSKDNATIVKEFLNNNLKNIIEIYADEKALVKEQIQKCIGTNKKVAIVDVGWNGSGPLGLKYLIEEKWKLDCKVSCLLAGSKTANPAANMNELLDGDIIPYLFARNLNRENYDIHTCTNAGKNGIFFEMFTQDTTPSFSGRKKNGEYIFELPETENYQIIREVHKGIIEYCKIYKETFKNYKYMYNISGHDAYCPFRMIIRDLSFIKRYFGDFIYARNVGNSTENYNFLTLNELIEREAIK